MDLSVAKEFVGKNEAEAIEKAAQFFGVSAGQLEIRTLPEGMKLSGLGTRVVVLASVSEEPVELGPVGEFVAGVLERMGVGGSSGLNEIESDGEVLITLRGASLQNWARQDSRVLGALTHLASRVAQRRVGEDASARVELPGEQRSRRGENRGETRGDYRGEHRDGSEDAALEKLAQESAAEVSKTGEPVVLRPMNSKERWVIHNAVKEFRGLRSESTGEGRTRRVKIERE